MKAPYAFGLSLWLLLLAAPGWAAPPGSAQLQAQGLAVIQSFFTQLKGELKAGMKKGGPVEAIRVCQVQAPAIAQRVGAAGGWRVGRTSERTRNPANTPDAWEAWVLADFAARAQSGTPPSELVFSAVVTDAQGKRVFRLMKGIGVGGMCLVCHGSPSPAVREQLQRLYPADQATGYRPGQFRGAFTLQKVLD